MLTREDYTTEFRKAMAHWPVEKGVGGSPSIRGPLFEALLSSYNRLLDFAQEIAILAEQERQAGIPLDARKYILNPAFRPDERPSPEAQEKIDAVSRAVLEDIAATQQVKDTAKPQMAAERLRGRVIGHAANTAKLLGYIESGPLIYGLRENGPDSKAGPALRT